MYLQLSCLSLCLKGYHLTSPIQAVGKTKMVAGPTVSPLPCPNPSLPSMPLHRNPLCLS